MLRRLLEKRVVKAKGGGKKSYDGEMLTVSICGLFLHDF